MRISDWSSDVCSSDLIYGIGRVKAKEICETIGLPRERRVNELTDAEVLQIREAIDRDYKVEGDLRREVAMNIKRLMEDRKSVVKGKRGSVGVDHGGRRIIKKKK